MRLRSAGFGLALLTALAQCGPPACDPAPAAQDCTPQGVPADARQAVLVHSFNGTYAHVDLVVKDGNGAWTCVRMAMVGRVGRNGVRPLAARRSGDGTTPGGTFGVGTMTDPTTGAGFQFFGNGANPGVPGAWHQVRAGDCWEESPGDPAYNTLVSRPQSACVGPDDEYLPGSPTAYSRAVLIDANMGPNRSGDQPGEPALAAAIFLHRYSLDAAGNSKPTAGCVSLAGGDLDVVLTRLVPGQAYFVIT
jgi:L,D-peptidoglycan transpeptidase YkuD (ErfK/YbiS/YcfS/YnhG family)